MTVVHAALYAQLFKGSEGVGELFVGVFFRYRDDFLHIFDRETLIAGNEGGLG